MEENDRKELKIENTIVDKIKTCEIQMKPRYFFIVLYTLFYGGILFLLVSTTWFINIVIYKIRSQYLWEYLSYGDVGLRLFILNIPLLAAIVSIVLFIILLTLLRKSDLFYKSNYLLLIFGVILLLVGICVFIDVNNLNKHLDNDNLLGNMYHNYIISPDWIMGTVIYRDDKSYYVTNIDGRYFRAVPVNKNVIMPLINRNECIKIYGVILNKTTISSHRYYKCPFQINN